MYWLDWSVNRGVKQVGDEFGLEFISDLVQGGYSVTDTRFTKLMQAVHCLFLNVSMFTHDGVLNVTLDKNDYSRDLIYNGRKVKRRVSYTYTLMLFDWLQEKSYATLTTGFVSRYTDVGGKLMPAECESSRLVFSDSFMERYKHIIKDKRDVPPIENVLRMRDSNKNFVPFKMGEYERWVCKLLKSINKGTKQFDVQCGEKMFDVQFAKVYNENSLNKGGRTYVIGGGSEVLHSEYRKGLIVDNEETVELDFKSLHPRLIATMYGWSIPIDHDPYEISLHGYHPQVLRKICKLLILCMFNANSRSSAISAVNKELNDTVHVDENGNEVPIRKYWIDNGLAPKHLELKYIGELLLEHNPYVKEAAYSGCGLDLQNLDSRIMDIVLAYFHEKGEFCLPVHDSVVVRKSLQNDAERVMREAFEQVMGNADNCVIEIK